MIFNKIFNIKKIIAIIASAVLCAAFAAALAGCADKSQKSKIYFELPQVPETADPQTASGNTELILVRNLFEGLLRYDDNGKIACGAAKNYYKNNNSYIFILRSDACWENGEQLTADDFVFGMRRAADPKTKSPFASRLLCIENAEKISRGEVPPEALGVKAEDKHTLVITLCREDKDFFHNLTTAPFMPCNEKFFKESVGRYGLERKYVLANGSYYMRKWQKSGFGIRLYRNKEYYGNFPARNAGVFLSCKTDSTPFAELSEKRADAVFLSAQDRKKACELGFSEISTENICWVMTMGNALNPEMRRALSMLCNKEIFEADLPYGIRAADSLFPAALEAGKGVSGVGIVPYDEQKAKKLFSEAVQKTENKKFPATVLKYYAYPPVKDTVTSIVAHWQRKLSAFINIESTDKLDSLLSQLTDSDMNMAVFPITAESPSVKDYLHTFGKSANGTSLAEIQKEILKENRIIPLSFESTAVVFRKELSGVRISEGSGHIDFAFIVKKK